MLSHTQPFARRRCDTLITNAARCVATLLALAVFATDAHAQGVDLDRLDAYFARARSDWQVPGFAVAIVKDDAVVFAKGYGVRELGGQEPVDENTLFAIASNSKAFTTAALARLVDEGKLAAVLEVLGEIHRSHPTATEFALDSVAVGESGLQAGKDIVTHVGRSLTWLRPKLRPN